MLAKMFMVSRGRHPHIFSARTNSHHVSTSCTRLNISMEFFLEIEWAAIHYRHARLNGSRKSGPLMDSESGAVSQLMPHCLGHFKLAMTKMHVEMIQKWIRNASYITLTGASASCSQTSPERRGCARCRRRLNFQTWNELLKCIIHAEVNQKSLEVPIYSKWCFGGCSWEYKCLALNPSGYNIMQRLMMRLQCKFVYRSSLPKQAVKTSDIQSLSVWTSSNSSSSSSDAIRMSTFVDPFASAASLPSALAKLCSAPVGLSAVSWELRSLGNLSPHKLGLGCLGLGYQPP